MLDIVVILIHSIVTVIRLMKPGGLRAVVAESALTRHQILILNRSRKRANLPRIQADFVIRHRQGAVGPKSYGSSLSSRTSFRRLSGAIQTCDAIIGSL